MQTSQIFGLAIGFAAALVTVPASAAQVIGGPTGSQLIIASLPDGNYRFCSDRSPSDVSRVSGVCFRFRKQDSDVVGEYYYPYRGDSLCINGQVNGNTVTGQGVEPLSQNPELPLDLPKGDARADWSQEGWLEVGRAQLILRNEDPERIQYRSLIADLNGFYQYNAGTVLPPQSCFSTATDPRYNNEYSTVPSSLTAVGESAYYEQPVYLDEDSIREVEPNQYRYRTHIGLNAREAESDLSVNCENPSQVRIIRTRYYNESNQVSEVEAVGETQTVADQPPNTALYSANQIICNSRFQSSSG